MGNELSQHVDQAKKTGILQLRSFKLTKLPPEIFPVMQFVRNLDLSGNKLALIPDELFTNAKNLKTLNLSGNRLEALPGQIGQLAKLETLNVSENQLIILPVQISQLKSLKTINLSQNRLNKIPSALYQLPQLDHLDLSKNRIQSIGDSKGGDAESQLEKLNCIELNLNENQVSYISPKLAQCPRLKVLRLEQNNLHLQAIPTSLLADSKVSLLSLDGNVFTPKQFESLEGYEKYLERYTATRRKFD